MGFAPFDIAQARAFVVSGVGQFDVTQIDLGVLENSHSNSFTAAIWTSSSGLPGTMLWSADLTTTAAPSTCCALVSTTGITGVTLAGGTQYFMVLTPDPNTDVAWQDNTTGVIATRYASLDGGATWINDNLGPEAAFDVLGTPVPSPAVPEPASALLLGGGLAAWFAAARRKARRP